MDKNVLEKAVQALKQGELVAFPTETVYGLGADASNPEAVAKIFQVKGRPSHHPVIVHVADMAMLKQWVAHVPLDAEKLASVFWPGPLTLILPKAPTVSERITGGQSNIGLRIPRHPVAQALLREFGGGIAAPSANRFGRISPTTADHVRADLGKDVALVLDGGACPIGVESTIVDVTTEEPRLLRPGMIHVGQLQQVLGRPLAGAQTSKVRAPGMLASHYAPRTPLQLIVGEQLERSVQEMIKTKRVVVLSRHWAALAHEALTWVTMPESPEQYAYCLYATLRQYDSGEYDVIMVEAVPNNEPWAAIADRLQRAAAIE